VFHVKAETIVDTILGEAVGGSKASRYADMLAIAQVMENRAQLLNVPMKDTLVEFDAFGKSLPKGVGAYKSLAEKALAEVMANPTPVHRGTFYATPTTTGNLPKGLKAEHTTTGHQYFSDPKGRAIGTAQGYKSPRGSLEAWGLPATAPAPSSRPSTPAAPATTAGTTNSVRGSSMATPFGGLAYRGLETPGLTTSPTVGRGALPGSMFSPTMTPTPAADFRGIPMSAFTPMPAYAPEDFSFPGSRAAMNIGLAHGQPGYVAGVPARSVTTTSIGPAAGKVAMTPAELASRYSPSSAASRLGVAKSTDPASSRVAQAHSTAAKAPAVNPAYAQALQAYAASRMAAMKGPTTGRQVAAAPHANPTMMAPTTRAPAVMAYAPAPAATKAPAPAAPTAPAPVGPLGLFGLIASLFGPGAGMGGTGISQGFGVGNVGANEAAGYGQGGYGNAGYGGAQGMGSNYSGL
jgi:hypothetical protein